MCVLAHLFTGLSLCVYVHLWVQCVEYGFAASHRKFSLSLIHTYSRIYIFSFAPLCWRTTQMVVQQQRSWRYSDNSLCIVQREQSPPITCWPVGQEVRDTGWGWGACGCWWCVWVMEQTYCVKVRRLNFGQIAVMVNTATFRMTASAVMCSGTQILMSGKTFRKLTTEALSYFLRSPHRVFSAVKAITVHSQAQ